MLFHHQYHRHNRQLSVSIRHQTTAEERFSSPASLTNLSSARYQEAAVSLKKYTIVLRVLFFALMVGVNCVMWTTFTKSLRFSSTSLEATITNTAANFFFTAILGQVLFGEVVRSLWWMGTVLIISGLLLMHHASNIPPRKPGTRPKTH
ncbi:transmembrane protein 42 isoform X2 [Panulirus ornatus]|uniref:transmembrane protein 42 isoform X2 n=1 Tax=Panulirus ornatus TaxID=150431 RepID=UPI003A889D72